MELDKISNIELGNIDTSDYPDMVDAYIVSAEIDGVELTDEELEELNKEKIFPRRYFYPSLNTIPFINEINLKSQMPISEDIAPRRLCLPL